MMFHMSKVEPEVVEAAAAGLASQYVRLTGVTFKHRLVPMGQRRGLELTEKMRARVLDLLR